MSRHRPETARFDRLGGKEALTAKHGMWEIVCPECEAPYTANSASIMTC